MPRKNVNKNGLYTVEQLFCDEYLVDHKEKQAAIRAGIKPSNASSWASDIKKKPRVAAYIAKREAEISRRLGISAERNKAELAKVGYINAVDVIDATDATVRGDARREDTSAIQSVKVKTTKAKDGTVTTEREVRLYDKNKALELLGRADGMFTDNLNANVQGTIVIEGYNDDAPQDQGENKDGDENC